MQAKIKDKLIEVYRQKLLDQEKIIEDLKEDNFEMASRLRNECNCSIPCPLHGTNQAKV